MAYKCSSDTMYCVHSEIELLYNTCEMHFVARLMDVDLDEIHDHMDGDILVNLSRQYHIWYDQIATPIEKSLIGFYFIHNSHYQMTDLSSMIAHRLVDSYALTKKTALPYSSRRNQLIDVKGPLSKLLTRKNILNTIKADRKLEFFLAMFYGKLALYTNNITHTLLEVVEYHYNRFERPEIDRAMSGLRSTDFMSTANPDDIFLKTHFIEKKINKKESKGIKRIFNKSLVGLKSFLGANETRAFVSGEEVKVEGELFDYIIKKSMSLLKYTEKMDNIHIPYDLSIHSKNGEYITKMCVIFPGSPVLDQVLSLYLMIKSGKEEELLRTGNFYGQRGDAYYTDLTFKALFNTKFAVSSSSRITQLVSDNRDIDLDVIASSFSLAFGPNDDPGLAEAMNRSSALAHKVDMAHPRIKETVLDSLLKSTGLDLNLKEAFHNQELSWDEMTDYFSIGIALPDHLDGVKKMRTNISSFNQLHMMVQYDAIENSVTAVDGAPKKILQILRKVRSNSPPFKGEIQRTSENSLKTCVLA